VKRHSFFTPRNYCFYRNQDDQINNFLTVTGIKIGGSFPEERQKSETVLFGPEQLSVVLSGECNPALNWYNLCFECILMKYLPTLTICLFLIGGCSNSGESPPDGSDAGQDADSGINIDGSDAPDASDASDASDAGDAPLDAGDEN